MVFWDADTWMFPALLHSTGAGRVMGDYRSDTLPAAAGMRSTTAMRCLYPWTSGLTGDMGDECYGSVTNDQGKSPRPNKSCTQQLHLQSDVAFAQWPTTSYRRQRWLAQKGWPVLEAVAQFWYPKPNPPRADTRLTLCRRPMIRDRYQQRCLHEASAS